MNVEFISKWTILPEGMELSHFEAHHFSMSVEFKGEYQGKSGGGYAVTHLAYQLSRASRKWEFSPPRFRQWQFRWPTFEEAQAVAREEVERLRVNGRTYAEWQEYYLSKEET